jgi:pimeloyl-ACP methyl ester carboxylesterase
MVIGNPVSETRPSSWRVTGREVLALARQAILLHRDLPDQLPQAVEPGQDVVVLLHGLFATAGVLRPLRDELEGAGAHTASLSYAPGPGIDELARRLGRLLVRLPYDVRIHLVGHSMGGLVARWFVQEQGGDPRVVQTVALASPFYGTRHARLMFGVAGRDIAPESPLLRRLRQSAAWCGVPHVSVAAAHDAVVTESALFEIGEHVVIADAGHNSLLYHRDVAALVVGLVSPSAQ